jgi:hypothetical protein
MTVTLSVGAQNWIPCAVALGGGRQGSLPMSSFRRRFGCQGEPEPAQEYGEVLVDDLLWVMAEASGRRADQALG